MGKTRRILRKTSWLIVLSLLWIAPQAIASSKSSSQSSSSSHSSSSSSSSSTSTSISKTEVNTNVDVDVDVDNDKDKHDDDHHKKVAGKDRHSRKVVVIKKTLPVTGPGSLALAGVAIASGLIAVGTKKALRKNTK